MLVVWVFAGCLVNLTFGELYASYLSDCWLFALLNVWWTLFWLLFASCLLYCFLVNHILVVECLLVVFFIGLLVNHILVVWVFACYLLYWNLVNYLMVVWVFACCLLYWMFGEPYYGCCLSICWLFALFEFWRTVNVFFKCLLVARFVFMFGELNAGCLSVCWLFALLFLWWAIYW